jgi:hypothetical protein
MKKESLHRMGPVLESVLVELPGHLAAPMEIGTAALFPVGLFLVARLVTRVPLFPALVFAGVGGGVIVGVLDLLRRRRTKKERDRLLRDLERRDHQPTDDQTNSVRSDHADR